MRANSSETTQHLEYWMCIESRDILVIPTEIRETKHALVKAYSDENLLSQGCYFVTQPSSTYTSSLQP